MTLVDSALLAIATGLVVMVMGVQRFWRDPRDTDALMVMFIGGLISIGGLTVMIGDFFF